MSNLYIGLMSGTSIDAMDAVLADFDNGSRRVIAKSSRAWTKEEKSVLSSLCKSGNDELEKASRAGIFIAKAQAQCIKDLLAKASISSADVKAVGSHGQTVRHCPDQGFSVQLNNPALLAELCNIDVISDFRARDLALGGEGAPLTPAFNSGFFKSDEEPRYILNLGGIANITVLNTGGEIISGFDTGPANTLLDLCARRFLKSSCDLNAQAASKGRVNQEVLNELILHPYFGKLPPKSTGRELFNEDFIAKQLLMVEKKKLSENDLLATLTELTVKTASMALLFEVSSHNLKGGTLILCGGGAKNPLLCSGFKKLLSNFGIRVCDCSEFGAGSDTLEALSFAYFAYLFTKGLKLNLGSSSKASKSAIAGNLTPAADGWFVRMLRKEE